MSGGRGQRAARGPATVGKPGTASALDPDAHRPGGAGDDLLSGLDGGRVQVGHLGLRDVPDLGTGNGANLGLVRLGAALVYARGLLDQLRRRRRLGDEAERPVLVNRDFDRDDVASLALRRSVVLLDEVHDVHAVRAQGGTDWRRRGGRAGRQLHLDEGGELLPSWRHCGMSLTGFTRAWSPGRTQ